MGSWGVIPDGYIIRQFWMEPAKDSLDTIA